MSVNLQNWYAIGGSLGAVAGAVGYLVRRYSRSTGQELQSFGAYVVGSVRLQVGRHFSGVLARQFGLRRYAERRLQSHPPERLIPSAVHQRINIDKTYVSLSLSEFAGARMRDVALLEDGIPSALLFGEPGSGKSSLTTKLFRDACRTAYLQHHQARLPVHIELRGLAWGALSDETTRGTWLLEQVKAAVTSVQGLHDPAFVWNAFSHGPGLVVFLDGLDEVPTSNLTGATGEMTEMMKVLRESSVNTTVIVTARTQLEFSLPRSFVEGFSRIYTIDSFSPADVFAFLRRWPYSRDRLTEALRIHRDLHDHPTLAEMCSNPLILAMYVAHDQAHSDADAGARDGRRPVRLPDTRPDFYKLVVSELLLHRRAEQPGTGRASTRLLREREILLGRIALDHLRRTSEPANSARWDAAIAVTRDYLQLDSDDEAEAALKAIEIETGIFMEERIGESLRFMHLTLCEYLAAKEVQDTEEETLPSLLNSISSSGNAMHSRRMWDVAIFALALVGRTRRERALGELRQQGAPPEFILRVIRESQHYEVGIFKDVLLSSVSGLASVNPVDWNAQWFADTKLLASCLTDAARLMQVRRFELALTVTELFERLIDDDSGRFARLFDVYLEVDPPSAVAMAGRNKERLAMVETHRLIRAMEQPRLVTIAIERVVNDEDPHGVWTLALAESGLRHELVAQLLSEEKAPLELMQRAAGAGARHRWHERGAAAGSLYGCVLALAAARIGSLESGFDAAVPSVGVVAELEPGPARLDAERSVLNLAPRAQVSWADLGGSALLWFKSAHLIMPTEEANDIALPGLELDVSAGRLVRVKQYPAGEVPAGARSVYPLNLGTLWRLPPVMQAYNIIGVVDRSAARVPAEVEVTQLVGPSERIRRALEGSSEQAQRWWR